jgi:transposase
LFDRRVRASEQERVDALDGRLPAAHRLVLKQRLDRIELLERQRDELQKCLEQLMEHCASSVKRLTAVPGINVVAAQHLIAEIGPEVPAFRSAGQLASWVGVCPGRQESAVISRSNRCAKGNRFVRALICQIAHAASRTKGSYWEGLFQRWQKRLEPNKALWAVAHRMPRLIWKIPAEAVDYIEHGPRVMDPARLAARMKRLRREFRLHGIDLDFKPINGESMA